MGLLYTPKHQRAHNVLDDLKRSGFAFVLGGIPQHTRADAELALFEFEDVMIGAALTTVPKSIIVSQLIERYGNIA